MYAIEPLYIDGLAPKKAHPDDAAFDLRAAKSADLFPGKPTLINCGVAMAIPDGYVGLICSRSGLAYEGIIVFNAPGVIDQGYRGDIGVILMSFADRVRFIRPGDRIAQLLILPNSNFRLVQTEKLPEAVSKRNRSGFGSTGLRSINPYSKKV